MTKGSTKRDVKEDRARIQGSRLGESLLLGFRFRI